MSTIVRPESMQRINNEALAMAFIEELTMILLYRNSRKTIDLNRWIQGANPKDLLDIKKNI